MTHQRIAKHPSVSRDSKLVGNGVHGSPREHCVYLVLRALPALHSKQERRIDNKDCPDLVLGLKINKSRANMNIS